MSFFYAFMSFFYNLMSLCPFWSMSFLCVKSIYNKFYKITIITKWDHFRFLILPLYICIRLSLCSFGGLNPHREVQSIFLHFFPNDTRPDWFMIVSEILTEGNWVSAPNTALHLWFWYQKTCPNTSNLVG